jgi:UDP-2-acetamido-3-amino-2,3-dideoxy-glucuronate N-acetyltransferase
MSKYKIHLTAEVQTDNIGDDTVVWQHTIILKGAQLGKNCNINAHCLIENDVLLGDNVTIKSGVYLWDGIHIEDNVFVGPNATFINNKMPRSKQYPEKPLRTYIEKGASIGAGAVILAGIKIGSYAMIGAGSVVTKNVPPHTLWFGNPAEMHGYVCICGQRLTETFTCSQCKKTYIVRQNILEQSS